MHAKMAYAAQDNNQISPQKILFVELIMNSHVWINYRGRVLIHNAPEI